MQMKLFEQRIKIYRNCIKIHQNDKVQKDVKNETKNNNTSSQNASRSLLYAFGLLL